MLTPVEQVLFIILAVLSLGATYYGFQQMARIIGHGDGRLYFDRFPSRLARALGIYFTQSPTLKARPITSLFHLAVVWGFTFYFLINFADVLEGFIPDYRFLGESGVFSNLYRLGGDLFSVAVLVGVIYLLLRRFVLPNQKQLDYHDNILLHPKVQSRSISRDSLIVIAFIILHVGARFLGQAAQIADPTLGGADPFRPFATLVAPVFAGLDADGIRIVEHLMWWIALGGILLFLPYFPYTKHAHLFMAPFNYLSQPRRTSLGEMPLLDLEDEEREQFGVSTLYDLPMTHIVDGYACIMCNRCQDVCPAYVTGKELSPAAYEVNKRYQIKDVMVDLSGDEAELTPLMGSAISESAVWACTACGACIDICPVGNEPMLDILEIRRDAVLMQGDFPQELQTAFNGMERQGNPWQVNESRMRWANGLDFPVPTVEENPDFEVLYWVGCAAAYDPRAQLTARALVKVLHTAGVSFAVLGEQETCTGDSARRAGNEFLYQELAMTNVETLNAVNPRRIVVTCPHCYHNLDREYQQFGGAYDVVHHTELIEELIEAGRLPLEAHPDRIPNVTFHDPCYLGRHNGILDAPRDVLRQSTEKLIEMPRHGQDSFCCGAGGAQFWKEEEPGDEAVNIARYQEAKSTGADVLAVGCPFCMQMFNAAQSDLGDGPELKDVAEIIADRLPEPRTTPSAD